MFQSYNCLIGRIECVGVCFSTDSELIGGFQKISIPYHGRLLGFPKGRGGSRLWNSEGMGGIFTIGYPKALVNYTGGISGGESVE